MKSNKPMFWIKFSKNLGTRFLADKDYPVFKLDAEEVQVPVNIEKKLDKMDENLDVDETDLEVREKEIKSKMRMQLTSVVWLTTINEKNKLEFVDASKVTCYYY